MLKFPLPLDIIWIAKQHFLLKLLGQLKWSTGPREMLISHPILVNQFYFGLEFHMLSLVTDWSIEDWKDYAFQNVIWNIFLYIVIAYYRYELFCQKNFWWFYNIIVLVVLISLWYCNLSIWWGKKYFIILNYYSFCFKNIFIMLQHIYLAVKNTFKSVAIKSIFLLVFILRVK